MREIEDWIVVTKEHSHWPKGTVFQPFSYNIRDDVEYRICNGETVYVNNDESFTAESGVKYIPKQFKSKLRLTPFENSIGIHDWVEISEATGIYWYNGLVVYIEDDLHLKHLQDNCTLIPYNGKIVYPEENKPFKAQHEVPYTTKGYGELLSESHKDNTPKYLLEISDLFYKLSSFTRRRATWTEYSEQLYKSKEITSENLIAEHTSLLTELESLTRTVNQINKRLTQRVNYLTKLTKSNPN